MVGLLLKHLNVFAEQLLNPNQVAGFGFIAERIGQAFTAGASRPPYAMDVDLGLVGQVEVEHVGDVLHVDAATRDVGRHENENVPVAEGFQRTRPCGLTLVAVNGIGRDANLAQLLRKTVCSVLGSGEDDAARDHLAFKQIDEQLTLVGLLDKGHVLLDAVGGRCLRADVHLHRTMQHLVGQLTDGFGHRCAEHQVLSLARDEAENTLHVLAEAHVKHAVGFVEHEMLDLAKINMALFVQIEQATGGRHQHVHPATKGLHLRRLADTAEDDGGIEREVATVDAQAVADLGRQFPSRREHERTDGPAVGGFLSGKMVKDGKGERRCFSRTGLGDTEHVSAVHQGRNGFRLHRCWCAVAFAVEGLQNSVVEMKFSEG